MATSFASDKEKRSTASSNSMFELLLFRLGQPSGNSKHELFGINVFKVREIMVMPEITAMVNAGPNVMGIANVRGQLIPVVNLPQIVGCTPSKGLGILLVTEFARTPPAFAVEAVSAETEATSTEILVTARRREEQIQDVPIAISVINSNELEATGSFNVG